MSGFLPGWKKIKKLIKKLNWESQKLSSRESLRLSTHTRLSVHKLLQKLNLL